MGYYQKILVEIMDDSFLEVKVDINYQING